MLLALLKVMRPASGHEGDSSVRQTGLKGVCDGPLIRGQRSERGTAQSRTAFPRVGDVADESHELLGQVIACRLDQTCDRMLDIDRTPAEHVQDGQSTRSGSLRCGEAALLRTCSGRHGHSE